MTRSDQAQTELNDLRVELRFTDARAFPSRLVSDLIEEVEKAVYQVEIEEIELLRSELSDVPGAVFDAMRYRAAKYEGRTLNFDSAATSSILLGGAAVALALWLLDKTFGETVKEAWQKTKTHETLKATLSGRLERKAGKIAEKIRPQPYRYRHDESEVRAHVEKRGTSIVIVVVIKPDPEHLLLPTAREVLADIADA